MTLDAEAVGVGEVGLGVSEVGNVLPGEGWGVEVDEGSVTVMTLGVG
jgi:hypothetical protein